MDHLMDHLMGGCYGGEGLLTLVGLVGERQGKGFMRSVWYMRSVANDGLDRLVRRLFRRLFRRLVKLGITVCLRQYFEDHSICRRMSTWMDNVDVPCH